MFGSNDTTSSIKVKVDLRIMELLKLREYGILGCQLDFQIQKALQQIIKVPFRCVASLESYFQLSYCHQQAT